MLSLDPEYLKSALTVEIKRVTLSVARQTRNPLCHGVLVANKVIDGGLKGSPFWRGQMQWGNLNPGNNLTYPLWRPISGLKMRPSDAGDGCFHSVHREHPCKHQMR